MSSTVADRKPTGSPASTIITRDGPTLIVHGDDDQIVPIGASAVLSSKLVKGSTLKICPGWPRT